MLELKNKILELHKADPVHWPLNSGVFHPVPDTRSDVVKVQMYLNDVFTVTVNLAGLPGIAVPVGQDAQGLPLGLQLIGRPWEEGDLLNVAYSLEQSAGFVAKPQKWW